MCKEYLFLLQKCTSKLKCINKQLVKACFKDCIHSCCNDWTHSNWMKIMHFINIIIDKQCFAEGRIWYIKFLFSEPCKENIVLMKKKKKKKKKKNPALGFLVFLHALRYHESILAIFTMICINVREYDWVLFSAIHWDKIWWACYRSLSRTFDRFLWL